MPVPIDPSHRARLLAALKTYEGLVAAIRDVLDEGWPTKQELQDAPELHNWAYGTRTVPCLRGEAFGHPALGDGSFIRTSPLMLQNVGVGVVRTESRWYRLAQQTDQDPQEIREIGARLLLG